LDEAEWRLKSRATWLKEGDNNNKKFLDKFANFRKTINNINQGPKWGNGVLLGGNRNIREEFLLGSFQGPNRLPHS
jgi:hypothetical protein